MSSLKYSYPVIQVTNLTQALSESLERGALHLQDCLRLQQRGICRDACKKRNLSYSKCYF